MKHQLHKTSVLCLASFVLSLSAQAAFTRLATETYPGGGGGGPTNGVTAAQATNIAAHVVSRDVAPWAMKGQPKPATDLSGITNLVAASSAASTNYANAVALAATNYTDAATNALDLAHLAALAATNTAIRSMIAASAASSTNYTDAVKANYLPLAGGEMKGSVFMGENPIYLDGTNSISSYEGRVQFADDESGKITHLTIDNTPVVTSNMLNGVLAPSTNAIQTALVETNALLRAALDNEEDERKTADSKLLTKESTSYPATRNIKWSGYNLVLMGPMLFETWSKIKAGTASSNTELPEYLADGTWNTAADPFAKKSDLSSYLPKKEFLFVENALTEYADIRIVGPGEVNVYGEAFVISNIDGNTYKITNKNGHNYIKYHGQTSAQAVSSATVNYGVEIELYDGGDWNDFTGFRNWMDYSNFAADDRSSTKADLVSGATANHFASLTANGNLADSGKKASDFAPSIEGGYYPFEQGNIVSNTVSQWEGYWNGSNVYWSVTNYVELGNAKIMRLYEIQTNGVTREIWNDSDKYDIFFTNTLDAVSLTNNYTIGVVSNMLDSKADRAWGKYTSAGNDVPDTNMVWHTAPTTVFAGGFEFQKVAVAGGEIGVLVSQGAVPYASGAEGKFIIGDGFGTNYFGYVKKDDYIIATHVDDIEKTGDMVTLKYDLVFSGEYPIVYYSPTVLPVTAQTWIQLNKADGTLTPGAPYPVTFSTGAGYIKAHISFAASPQPEGYFTSSTAVIGGGTFKTNMKADFLDAGLMCTNTDTKVMGVIRPTFDGTTVHWNWSKQ